MSLHAGGVMPRTGKRKSNRIINKQAFIHDERLAPLPIPREENHDIFRSLGPRENFNPPTESLHLTSAGIMPGKRMVSWCRHIWHR